MSNTLFPIELFTTRTINNIQDIHKTRLIENANAELYKNIDKSLKNVNIDILAYISSLLIELEAFADKHNHVFNEAIHGSEYDRKDMRFDTKREVIALEAVIAAFYGIAQTNEHFDLWNLVDFTNPEVVNLLDARLIESLKNKISPLEFKDKISPSLN